MDELIRLLDRAAAILDIEKEDGYGSRALSITLTHIETAQLWREKDLGERKTTKTRSEEVE